MSNIIKLADRTPQRALETLNRMTGLEFDCWPESLISASATAPTSACPAQQETPQAGTLLPFMLQRAL